ncbi:hypothetical protein [uncultured Desulfovibrio sp.]|uniref:hypothetical protein n=1 Tax=uncultured Desulfovibrio sp. TaxID=167968 RepID=UPI002630B213|nr:hypothetical protein [uncultured Desulfovibrio sp.]
MHAHTIQVHTKVMRASLLSFLAADLVWLTGASFGDRATCFRCGDGAFGLA